MLRVQTLELCLAAGKRITMENSDTLKYPMLQAILAIQDLQLQPMYTNRDVAKIFKVCVRAIQNWITAGRLAPRALPGRWKFFPQDLEDFLHNSQKGRR
jgi:hypothetical protein